MLNLIKRPTTATSIAAFSLLVTIPPAAAQIIGGAGALGSPTAIITALATGALAAGGAAATIAGSIKAYDVWTGGRNPWDAFKYLGLGVAMLFGTAALVGFNGG